MRKLTAYIDFKSPESYLAFHQTVALTEKNNIQVDWKPFLTKYRAIPATGANETKGETHLRIRAEHKKYLNLKYAEILNLPMKYPPIESKTDLALAMLSQLNIVNQEYLQLAFTYFWRDGLNLNETKTVNEMLTASGIDYILPQNTEHLLSALNQLTTQAKESGVIATPTYQIENQLFLGREHLPWIKEELTTN